MIIGVLSHQPLIESTTMSPLLTNVQNSRDAQTSAYRTDLVSCHLCQYVGSAKEANGAVVDLYYDPESRLVFKVVSEHSIDTVIYEPPAGS